MQTGTEVLASAVSSLSVFHRGPWSARGGPRWSSQVHGASDGRRSLFPKVSFRNCPAGPGPLGERPAIRGPEWLAVSEPCAFP